MGQKRRRKTGKDDPACKLVKFGKKVKEKVKKVRDDLGNWIEDRANRANGKGPSENEDEEDAEEDTEKDLPPIDENKLSAQADESQAKELERLKGLIGGKDSEIKDLEKQLGKQEAKLDAKLPRPKTVDELIAYYKRRLQRRDDRIAKLKAEIKKNRCKLEGVGCPKKEVEDVPTLADIEAHVDDMSDDVDEARRLRDKLDKDGVLDPELDHSLKGIFEQADNLEDEVGHLRAIERNQTRAENERRARALERKARRKAREAKRKAEEAAEKAKEMAKQSMDPNKLKDVGNALGGIGKNRKSKEGDDEDDSEEDGGGSGDGEDGKKMDPLLAQATKVNRNLDDVSKAMDGLDTGVHPHGEKWWRYRYEHAYVESTIMVFVSLLMLFWERFYHFMRWRVYKVSNAQEYDRITHGTMYISWLEFCAGELMTCLLVFLTCWLLGQMGAYGLFPVYLRETGDLHLPNTGREYEVVALDVCVFFFFAIIFYYMLTLSIVFTATARLLDWAGLEFEQSNVGVPGQGALRQYSPGRARSLIAGGDEEALERYRMLKEYFSKVVMKEPAVMDAIQEHHVTGFNEQTFPFWIYMRLAIREKMDKMFMFGWTIWVAIVLTFVLFGLAHRFLHVGCIRIMIGILCLLVLVLACMVGWIFRIVGVIKNPEPQEQQDSTPQWSLHRATSTETIIICTLHYLLFFLCYGAARMICQPWMWVLHFWPVMYLTMFTLFLVGIFCYFVSPIIPDFCVALSMPPYVDPGDVRVMVEAMRINDKLTAEDLAQAVTPHAIMSKM